jgi:cytochrome-b5 reductase
MLAGGTGITPFYQILQAAHENFDTPNFTLIFGNKTTEDILLRNELDSIQESKRFPFKLNYLIDKPETGWTGLTGYVNKEMIIENFPQPSSDTLLLLCGPPVMCEKAKEIFEELKYEKENIYEF